MRTITKHPRGLWLTSVLLASVLAIGSEATALEVGAPAPDFTLPSTMGGEISLSQFRGKKHVLLEFYVTDFGPT